MSAQAARGWLGMAVAMTALVAWATWPLASCPERCLVDPALGPPIVAAAARADVDLTVWILASTTRALATDPRRLFDANVFHPAPSSLATTEHMLGALPVYLPFAWASGDVVAAHQWTLFATFVLSGLALAALVRAWTGSWAAAFAAGAAFAMSPFRLGHAGILPMAGTQYLPLIVLAAERTASAAVPARWAAALGALLVVQALHSYYLAYAAFVMTGVLLAVAFAGDPRARARWSWLVGAVGTAALVVVLVSWPYFAARGGGSDVPNPAFVQLASARPGKTGAPAMVLVALAALPLWRRATAGRVRGVWVLALASAAVACHLLALGPAITLGAITIPGPFALVAEVAPGWRLVRAPIRLGAPAVAGACALAGIALAGVLDLAGRRRRIVAVAVAGAAVVAVAAAVRRPLVVAAAETPAMIPAVYRWLATAPRGAVVEIPFHPFRLADRGRAVEARRTYRSVVHWQPLLGGYSGYTPPTYAAVAALAQALPDPLAAQMLQRVTGLRWIVLHRDELAPRARRAWAAARDGYRPVARFGRDVVLAPRPAQPADLLAAFLADGPATPLGTPRAPLAAADRRGRLAFETPPPRAPWWRPVSLALEIRNAGRAVWPALGATARGLVTLGYRWVDAAGAVAERTDAGRLPWDLAPAARVVAHAVVEPPPRGMRPVRLEIGLVQDGRWFEGGLAFPAGGPPGALSRRPGSAPRARPRRAAPAA